MSNQGESRGQGGGAVEWIRTTDLLITNQLLYQLSYNSTRNVNSRGQVTWLESGATLGLIVPSNLTP